MTKPASVAWTEAKIKSECWVKPPKAHKGYVSVAQGSNIQQFLTNSGKRTLRQDGTQLCWQYPHLALRGLRHLFTPAPAPRLPQPSTSPSPTEAPEVYQGTSGLCVRPRDTAVTFPFAGSAELRTYHKHAHSIGMIHAQPPPALGKI